MSPFYNNFDQGPLHFAVRFGDYPLTKTLLEKGADVNVMDIFGNTPLSLACIENPSLDIIRLLIEYGADVNFERTSSNLDLLSECVLNCKSKIQTDVILINRNCLHYAALTGYLPITELLLNKGAILDTKDNFSFTPMQLAEIHENEEIINLFQDYKIAYELTH
ncbi:hypothetical protein NQ318_009163 [Aromia moschata]|uniref:Ankyrin repeat protein n=1 Tax=Aromia moschata TaxID=1265417 RepID=A0AAV8XWM8_9CUCU|nr:hypothetical protein NQ318_009163 [Aromia moschata]